jgi:hypothetical protein
MTGVLIEGNVHRDRWKDDYVKTKAETGVMLATGRGKKGSSSRLQGVWPCQHLNFRLLALSTVNKFLLF